MDPAEIVEELSYLEWTLNDDWIPKSEWFFNFHYTPESDSLWGVLDRIFDSDVGLNISVDTVLKLGAQTQISGARGHTTVEKPALWK